MSLKNLDIRIKSFDENGEEGTFTAYGNVKWIVDRARECTIDNCFKWDTNRLPKMLVNHDFKQVCGVWTHIEEDEHGLKVHGKFALNTTLGRETYELVKMGALDSLSIGYVVNKERYDHRTNVTYLEDITIHELSIVTFECNQGSLIEDVKSDDLKLSYKSIEDVAENQEPEQEQEEPKQACIDANAPTIGESPMSINIWEIIEGSAKQLSEEKAIEVMDRVKQAGIPNFFDLDLTIDSSNRVNIANFEEYTSTLRQCKSIVDETASETDLNNSEGQEPVAETALNTVVDEEQETETESKEEIPTEVMQKLDNLVISLMLSKISF
ncbi:HK97 family phage prohead protease [Vibrio vulnificus]|nr:HK97 family phage prohead protease [Vibrio vulnificus]